MPFQDVFVCCYHKEGACGPEVVNSEIEFEVILEREEGATLGLDLDLLDGMTAVVYWVHPGAV
eukprot:CAMPEP_0195142686 /NCGR_PEP_ID=MMETSP0448-20130528/165053_1 /TAXON_ID=66468 /ORGANISM="Heterocapsa triquestra, Strain CCMP 448" /LENGTH=62 /DNA_ID=CAMNT_0040181091 /DNA_START=32 /DNA_END=217 /DNA_ORIENTATION=+